MSRIFLIRHGQSAANAGLRTSDPSAIPVTELGLQQAEQVALSFAEAPDLIVTSPFLRTSQTAQPLLDRYPTTRTEEWAVQEFTYLDRLRCIGTTFHERLPMMEEYWRRGNPQYREGEDGESFVSFLARVDAMMEKLARRSENSIAVFTHQYVMTAILWLQRRGNGGIDRAGMDDFYVYHHRVAIPNGAILRGLTVDSRFVIEDESVSHLSLGAKQP